MTEAEENFKRLFLEQAERDAAYYREGRMYVVLFVAVAVLVNVAVFLGFVVYPAMAH